MVATYDGMKIAGFILSVSALIIDRYHLYMSLGSIHIRLALLPFGLLLALTLLAIIDMIRLGLRAGTD